MAKMPKPRGPAPVRVKIDAPFAEAVAKTLTVAKPAGGWPKPTTKPKKRARRADK